MLYDNSQLARVSLHAWQVTGNEFFRTITEEILDYVIREMTDSSGGFYSTQDADSEGVEGKFFVWTPDEIREILGDEAEAFMAAYGVTRRGNFEGKNILEFGGDLDQMQPMMGQYPLGFGQWLQALAYALSEPREIAIVGDPMAADTQALLGVLRDGCRPFQVVALGSPDAQPPAIPLLQDRGPVEGQGAAYACRDFACQAPVTEPEGLQAQWKPR
jgi:uncharacterized protein YyaL (SSP411 family)